MQVRLGSTYLRDQEVAFRQKAEQVKNTPIPQPEGTLRRVWWVLTGERNKALQERAREVRRLLQDAQNYARGRAGENALEAALRPIFDDSYVLLRNYVPPRSPKGGDIDAVLIGPSGVTVFEVKAYRGRFKLAHDIWWHRNVRTGRWRKAFENPTQQARMNVQRINKVLAAQNLRNIPVCAAVVIAARDMKVRYRPPVEIPLLFLYRRKLRLDVVLAPATLSAPVTEQVLVALHT